MYTPALLLTNYYNPLRIEKGMLFLSYISDEFSIWELDKSPVISKQEFIDLYGHPVELYIEDDNGNVLAKFEELAWVETTHPPHQLSIEEINYIINERDGFVTIKVDENGTPIFLEEKVVII